MPLVPDPKNCDISVKRAIQGLSKKLGYTGSSTHANVTLTDLTASSLIGTNASKLLESVTIGTGLAYARPTISLSHLGIEALTDPGADRIFFWDDDASKSEWLVPNTLISITGTNLNVDSDLHNYSWTSVDATDLKVGSVTQAFDVVLDDISALAVVTDNEFIVGTGAGTYAHESGATVRTSIGLGTGDSPTFAKLTVQDTTIETTLGYIGFYNDHRKTAGVTDHLDYFYGHQNYIVYNQTGGIIGTSCAFYNQFSLVDGDIGDVSNPKNLNGVYSFVDLNAGKVYGNVFGFQTVIDQEAANEVTGNIYGNYVDIDADGTVGGLVYGLYFNEGSNVDYGIYQNGTAPNVFGGNLIIPNGGTIGQAAGPLLTFDDTNNYLEITGCNVGIGIATPLTIFDIANTSTDTERGLYIRQISDNTQTSQIVLHKERTTGQSAQDNDGVGLVGFRFYNDAVTPEFTWAAYIRAVVLDVSDGTEDGELQLRTMTNGIVSTALLCKDNSVHLPNVKSGATQVAAGAIAGELWVTSGHVSQEDNTVMIGV